MANLLIFFSPEGKLELKTKYRNQTSQSDVRDKHLDAVLLNYIAHLLKIQKIPVKSLKGIGVVKGEMSLASQRLLLSAVNSLAWALGLSVTWISKKQFENPESIKWPKKTVLLKPVYARPAVITKSQK